MIQTKSPSLYEASIALFRTHIFGDPSARGKVIDGACELLLAERHGNRTDSCLLAAAVKMFHELQVYTSDFEPRMLTFSQSYITAWADNECRTKELPDYVAASVMLMENEMQRCEKLSLDTSTRRSLLTLLEDHLIERKEAELSKWYAVETII